MAGGTEILAIEPLSLGYVRLLKARVRLPDGAVVERELTETGDAACVLPYDPVRRVALVISTPRIPVIHATGSDAPLIEAPAGMLAGDAPEVCVRKEAMEEAGLRLGALERVACVWSSPGTSAERISLYLAAYSEADRQGPGGGAAGEHENITVNEVPLGRLLTIMNIGADIQDAKTLILVQALRLKRPEIFD